MYLSHCPLKSVIISFCISGTCHKVWLLGRSQRLLNSFIRSFIHPFKKHFLNFDWLMKERLARSSCHALPCSPPAFKALCSASALLQSFLCQMRKPWRSMVTYRSLANRAQIIGGRVSTKMPKQLEEYHI